MTVVQDLTPLKPVARLAKLKGGETSIWTVSRDLSTIATYNGSWDEFAEDQFHKFSLRIWDAKTRKERLICEGERDDPLECGALSPDGALLATGGLTKLQIWDTATGQCIKTCDHPGATRIKHVRFLAEGTQIITTTWRAGARIWDVSSGAVLMELPHDDRLNHLFITTDEKRILTGDRTDTKVWDRATGTCLAEYKHDPEAPAARPCLSSDGTVYAITAGGSIRLFNVDSGTEIRAFAGGDCTGFSPDGQHFCSIARNKIAIRSSETGETIQEFGAEVSQMDVTAFIYGERWFVFGPARVYELPTAF